MKNFVECFIWQGSVWFLIKLAWRIAYPHKIFGRFDASSMTWALLTIVLFKHSTIPFDSGLLCTVNLCFVPLGSLQILCQCICPLCPKVVFWCGHFSGGAWWPHITCIFEILGPCCSSNRSWTFYHNMFCIFIWYKELNLFCVFGVTWDICMCVCIWHLYLSVWSVTKHRGRSPSPMGVNWVSDRVSIDSTEYMHHKSVRFSGSLKQATVVDFWKRNGTIPVGTKLLLLSNRLQGFWWDRTILHWDFSVHVVVTTYTSVSVTKAFRILQIKK